MDGFYAFYNWLSSLPGWVLVLCPVGFLATGIVCVLYRKTALFLASAFVFGGLEGLLSVAVVGFERGVSVICLFLAEVGFLLLFLCLPPRVKKEGKKSRADAIFERFYQPLEVVPPKPAEPEPLPKVTALTDPPAHREEDGLRLEYVEELLKKLRSCKLTAGDRLETDVITRSLGQLKNGRLDAEQKALLNDYLASVLKLLAKYSVA